MTKRATVPIFGPNFLINKYYRTIKTTYIIFSAFNNETTLNFHHLRTVGCEDPKFDGLELNNDG